MFRLSLLAGLVIAAPAWAAAPELTQVVLLSGGVGQFSVTAEADGAGVIPLEAPLGQVDDLPKSLHVGDPAGGRAVVRLQGREPLAETFRTLPFGPAAFASPEALLAGLTVETVGLPGSPPVTGRILTLPADGRAIARLEGLAVVENLSGRDWRGVQVALTSGQPVLYHQPLYQAVFAPRPEALLLTNEGPGAIPPGLATLFDARDAGGVDEAKGRIDAIVQDQDRVRKNLAAVPAGDLQRRYVAQLTSQEDELAQLRTQQTSARQATTAADQALKDFLGSLSL